jgi:hypothetical protein
MNRRNPLRQAIVILTVVLALCAPATAAATTSRSQVTIGQLQVQVNALKTQVAALRGQVQSLSGTLTQTGQAVTTLGNFTLCMNAVYFDLFHLFYHALVAVAGATDTPTTPVDDKGTCAAAAIPRTPASGAYAVTPALDRLESGAALSNAMAARLPTRFFGR